MAATFKVKALYEYTSSHEDDLPFHVGQIITVTDEEDADWYAGEYVDDSGVKLEGIFPRNFVEKYEPTAPPRPTRIRKKEPESVPALAPAPTLPPPSAPAPPEREPAEIPQEPAIAAPPMSPVAEPLSPRAPVVPVYQPPEPEPVSAPAPAPPVAAPTIESPRIPSAPSVPSIHTSAQPPPKEPTQPRSPPPVAEKPAVNSFKDRIAAFNKPAAPPVAPFKPGGLGSGGSGFIKKPFVAPPPSRNAYVPPPQQAPTAKVYRRDEDPEIKEREAENQENAEKAGLAVVTAEGEDSEQPKPTSLKERIALLQKQQAEQAQRHAEAAAKKAKPKRPPPKRTDSETTKEPSAVEEAEAHHPPLERKDTADVVSKKSIDVSRSSLDEPGPPRQPPPIRRKSIKGPVEMDGNEADMSGAGDTTEGQEDLAEKDDSDVQTKPTVHAPEVAVAKPAEENAEEEEEEEEEEEDPEVRRREELRARMAKMSGGMGFHGMFGPPGMVMGAPAPPKKKKVPTPERRSSEIAGEPASPRAAAPPIPTMMALPGMGRPKPKEEVPETEQGDAIEENITPVASATSPRSEVPEPLSPTLGGAPPVPGSRPAPPPVPTQSRPPPPPPPAAVTSTGSETDDELSENPQGGAPLAEAVPTTRAPPVPLASPPLPSSPRPSIDRGAARFSIDGPQPTSPPVSPQFSKRNSRPPPPIPGGAPPPIQARPPPPPPPGALARPPTSEERVTSPMKPGTLDNGEEAENTEYEGDYDTDIASSVPHKDALKSHARESNLEDSTPVCDAPPSLPPPPPTAAAPKTGPPAVPSQPRPNSRPSIDKPRAPPPPPKSPPQTLPGDDYDPFNYNAAHAIASAQPLNVLRQEDSLPPLEATPVYQASSPPHGPLPASQPPREPPRAPPRKSLEVQKVVAERRSADTSRASMSAETGFMANDIDLAAHTNWWLAPNGLPPVHQGRKDIYFESAESTSPMPDGRTLVTKEVFILFQDYSQTVITIVSDPQDPSSTEVDQRHAPPPRALRQDQLEEAYETYGRQIANAVASRKDTVGDGTPHGLILELLKPFQDALGPVGTRAYGALVYANLANAATQMNDEIRAGDIVSFRNAKFSGKHGPVHAKYSTEVGKPDHVAVVAEWDGTKRKVRAWEQGRESKKCKQESFKLDDLRSGEVKVWRVMPRSWVGWNQPSSNNNAISQD